MPLASGSRLGPYEIQSSLGAGGMGEVYRARDTRLDRTVAIKILPDHLAENAKAKERFQREARAISSLSHPNICHLYDVGAQDSTSYLVMEFLEGETLADRLRKGPLPLEQFFKVAIEICDGLEKAHRSSVVHRDLKPGNIMLTKTGAKLMDFGLAKALPAETPASSLESKTLSTPAAAHPLTAQGTVIGTFQYMSPEQIEGKDADMRSDIFSLGAVLYEMLTGTRAFEGKSMTSVMAAVLERDPAPISTLQPLTPPALDRLVRTCLAKDPDERLQTVHDLKLQLQWISGAPSSQIAATVPAAIQRHSRGKLDKLGWLAAAVLALVLLAGIIWTHYRQPSVAGTPIFSYIPPPPDTHFLAFSFGAGPAVLSPDGAKLAFSAIDHAGKVNLWLRPLASHGATVLAGTENASAPFWSPDGQSLGFFADGKLKTINLSSGAVNVVCDVSSHVTSGTWSPQGLIVFASNLENTYLGTINSVSANGGTPTPLPLASVQTATFGTPSGLALTSPFFLPNGKKFLIAARDNQGIYNVEMASLDSPHAQFILANASKPAYSDGFLLFIRDSKLFAQPFDPAAAKLSGTPTMLTAARAYSVAANGTIVFQSTPTEHELEWLGLDGKPLEQVGEIADYLAPKISPDGKRILTTVSTDTGGDLWSIPAGGGVSTRLTFGSGEKIWSVWSPDGKYIAYERPLESGGLAIVRKPADGSGSEETLLRLDPSISFAPTEGWSPDGRYITYGAFSPAQHYFQLWALPLFGDHKPFLIAPVSADQFGGTFSPDGHWIGYFSYETGRPEVYVVPFPPRPGAKYQISQDGGWNFAWSKKNQIFFLSTGDQLIEADLDLTPQSLQVRSLRPLFPINVVDSAMPIFDVSLDGTRILAVTPARPESTFVGLLTNWTAAARK
ncbi:MAG: protein kinase [Candidatus Acidiferrales bacterium]